jgi:hypothetical protein
MEDFDAFCRQRLRASFLRRRRYPLGSEDRAGCVKDARMFLRFLRVNTGRIDRRRSIPKDQLTAEDISGPWLHRERDLQQRD